MSLECGVRRTHAFEDGIQGVHKLRTEVLTLLLSLERNGFEGEGLMAPVIFSGVCLF